jgi:molybdenum cofactor synthesis domain-containing protein
MDGFAVLAADGSARRRVLGEQAAGLDRHLRLEPGTAVRIMTGAPLPEGADSVVPVEKATESGGTLAVPEPPRSGQHVRPVGQDVATGERVLAVGTVLGAAELGLLASIGATSVCVVPRPRVAVLATGNELVPPDCAPGPGQIRDSNSLSIAAAASLAGFEVVSAALAPDDPVALRQAIREAVSGADMLLTCGGVSMGEHDYVKPLLAELGTVHFGRVASKPGKPLTFAQIEGVPVFGLPGFPVSSLVSFEVFVRPAGRLMAGHRRLWRPETPVRLEHDVRHDADRTEFQRATLTRRDGVLWARTTGGQTSGRLLSLVGANALLRLPAGRGDFVAGSEVTALLIEMPEEEREG